MQKKLLFKAIIVILLYLCWSILSQIPISIFEIELSSNMVSLYNFIVTFMFLVIVFLMYKEELLSDFKNINRKSLKYVFINVLVIFILMVLSNFVSYVVLKDRVISNINNGSLLMISNKNLLLLARLVILSPFIEEVVFRKSIKGIIKNKTFFILFSGLFLGSLYVVSQDPSFIGILSSISYLIVGLYLSYSYTKTDNIFINIISRIIYNLLALVLVI